jgi:GAF domain-containing protein
MGTRFSVRRTELPAESTIRAANRRQQSLVVAYDSIYEERSHLLPSVTYGIAVPLIARGEVLGVVDVQSRANENPFSDREITILELIASDLAWSLLRLRESQGTAATLAERDEINRTLEQQVNRLRHQLDQSLGSEWLTYLEGRGQEAIGFDMVGKGQALLSAIDIPPHLGPAMARGEMVVEQNGSEKMVTMPIKQRDEVLGAISFALPKDAKLSERQIEMASQVVNRLATALDNARLVEQTQAQVQRERKTSEVASMLLGQQEVHALLDTAAASFNEALGAIYTRIQIDPDMLLTGAPVEEAS